MSSLIDVDEMIKRLQEWNTEDDMDKALFNFAMCRVMEQSIAYDVDAVVKQLDELRDIDICEQVDCSSCPYTKSCNIDSDQTTNLFLDKVIEIIKGGGN